ncbi:MAG: hypothetical protein ABEH90_07410 [Halolamina sp.]
MSDSFRTNGGRCVVEEGHIRIEDRGRGWLATLREALTSEDIPPWRRLGVALFYVTLLAGVLLVARLAPVWLSGAALGLLLAVGVWSASRRRSAAEKSVVIPLSKVESVEARAGIPLVTRPRFVVRYRSEGGVKHRYLLCPSRLYGFGAYESGKRLFEEHGVLGDEAPA